MADETLHSRLLTAVDAFDTELETPGGLLDAASDMGAAVRAVIELHAPDVAWSCCDHEGASVDYPCSTIRTIAHELGITEDGSDAGN